MLPSSPLFQYISLGGDVRWEEEDNGGERMGEEDWKSRNNGEEMKKKLTSALLLVLPNSTLYGIHFKVKSTM